MLFAPTPPVLGSFGGLGKQLGHEGGSAQGLRQPKWVITLHKLDLHRWRRGQEEGKAELLKPNRQQVRSGVHTRWRSGRAGSPCCVSRAYADNNQCWWKVQFNVLHHSNAIRVWSYSPLWVSLEKKSFYFLSFQPSVGTDTSWRFSTLKAWFYVPSVSLLFSVNYLCWVQSVTPWVELLALTAEPLTELTEPETRFVLFFGDLTGQKHSDQTPAALTRLMLTFSLLSKTLPGVTVKVSLISSDRNGRFKETTSD